MSKLAAGLEQLESLLQQHYVTLEMRQFNSSLESLADLGRLVEPGTRQAGAFLSLVDGSLSIAGQELPEEAQGDVTASLEFMDGMIEKLKIVLKGREAVMAKKPKPGEDAAFDGKRWSKEYDTACVKLRQNVKDFYTNDKWLDAQTFVVGTVNASDFSARFTYKGKIREDIAKAYEESSTEYDRLQAKYCPLVIAYTKNLIAIDKEVAKRTTGVEDVKIIDDVLRDAIKKMRALPHPITQMGSSVTQFLGGCTLKFTKDSIDVKTEPLKPLATLPALDKAGVKAIGQLMLKVLDLHENWPNIPYDGVASDQGDDYQHHYDESAVMDEYYDICELNALDWELSEPVYTPFFRMQDIIGALDKWVDRSVK